MNYESKRILFGIIIFVLALTTIFFFSQTGLSEKNFSTLNLFPVGRIILSNNFLLFVLASSITLAMLIYAGKTLQYADSIIVPIFGSVLALIIGIVFFQQTFLIIPIIFSIIGIPFAIKFLEAKEKELQMLPELRAGLGAAGKITLIFSIGVFISLAISNYQIKDKIEKNFTSELIGVTIGDSQGLKESITNTIGQVIITTQNQTINQITSLEQFNRLRSKTDAETREFVLTMDSLKSQMNSKEYEQTVMQKIKENNENINLVKIIESSLPVNKISPYAWIIYSFFGFMMSLIISGFIVKNISGFIYYILCKITGSRKNTKISEENPKY